MQRALFLDRDGTLITERPGIYTRLPHHVIMMPGVIEFLQTVPNDVMIFIVSNQGGISKGFTTQEEVRLTNLHISNRLLQRGVEITYSYFCPHATIDNCMCRKPKPGMLFKAEEDYDLNLRRSVMIGNSQSDVQAGIAAGCGQSILFQASWSPIQELLSKWWRIY